MDNTAPAPERAALEEESAENLAAWVERQKGLAARFGLALLLVEGRQPPSLAAANNNSVCRAFQSTPAHAERCQPYCGEAFFRAQEAGEPVYYRCHAGLNCFAAPVTIEPGRRHAVIGGRAFLRGADYRELVERVRSGELSELLSTEPFQNVIFATRAILEECAEAVLAVAETTARAASAAPGEAAEGGGQATAEVHKLSLVNGAGAGEEIRAGTHSPPIKFSASVWDSITVAS